VSQLATEIFMDILKKNRRPLAKHYREQSNLKSFPWLRTAADDKAFKTHEEAEGQLAFGF
jgi:hypothetical protein